MSLCTPSPWYTYEGHGPSTLHHFIQTAGHTMRVMFAHLLGQLKAGDGDSGHSQLLMVCLLSGDGGAVGDHRRQQAGVELRQVHSEGVLEVKTSNVGGR